MKRVFLDRFAPAESTSSRSGRNLFMTCVLLSVAINCNSATAQLLTGWVNRDDKIVLSPIGDLPMDSFGLALISPGGFLIPTAGTSAAPFTFFLSNTPGQITYANLGTPPVTFDEPTVMSAGYDFDTAAVDGTSACEDISMSWGAGSNSFHRALNGDANVDGKVSFEDFLILSSNFAEVGVWPDGDFDCDRMIGFSDFLLLSSNFGQEQDLTPHVIPPPSDFCARIAVEHIYGEVANQPCTGIVKNTTFDFGQVFQGDVDSGLRSDVISVHALGGPFLVENFTITGSGRDAFDIPDFREFTLENNEFEAFDVSLNVDLPPGLYKASAHFLGSLGSFGEPLITALDEGKLFDFRAEILHPGDCNADGKVDAADLACVVEIEQRDVVLTVLNTLPGDLDGNGGVSFRDFLVLSANFGQALPSYSDGNIDLEDGIDFADFLVLSGNFGKSATAAAAVPEPGAATLLVVGLFCLVGRRSIVSETRGA